MATAATTRFEFEALSTRGCVPSPTSKLIKSHQELPTINSHKQLAFVRAVTSRTGGCAAGSSKDLEEPARGSGDPASRCCVRSARCSRQSACAYALGKYKSISHTKAHFPTAHGFPSRYASMNRYAFPCARLATRIQHTHVRARKKSIYRSITTAARLRLALRYAQSTPVTFTGEQSAYTSSSSPAANVSSRTPFQLTAHYHHPPFSSTPCMPYL